MSDWQVGDLVVCVDDTPAQPWRVCSVAKGCAYRFAGYTEVDVHGDLCCLVEGRKANNPSLGFKAYRFRKIRPDEHEACEEEFRILLKLSKQRVSA